MSDILQLYREAMENLRQENDRLEARIAELSQAVGLITTLKPTMLMDTEHPLDMAKEVAEHVTARIAELEEKQRWIPVSERLPEKYTPVWVTTTWGEQHSGNLTDDCWTGLFRDFREGEITHWMPLPPNPESPNDTQTQTIVYGKDVSRSVK